MRYLLFAWDAYCAEGGWGDFRGSSDDPAELSTRDIVIVEEIKKHVTAFDWWHIIDTVTLEVVDGNEKSLNYFRSCGYRVAAKT